MLAAVALGVAAAGCGGSEQGTEPRAAAGYDELLKRAQGQTMRWWMFGGDDRINAYVDEVVAPAVEDAGLELERVPVATPPPPCSAWSPSAARASRTGAPST